MKKIKTGDIVMVHWVDAIFTGGWKKYSELELLKEEEIPVVKSVGYLVFKNKTKVIVCQSDVPSNESAGDFLIIPRKYINTIKLIKKA